MTEYDFLLADRIQKIQSINDLYDLENKSYISFSGGKDSTVLSVLIDKALPGNKIPRVFINTGIEYSAIVKYVKSIKEHDERVQIIAPSKNIKETLKTYGYPFKSKEHSLYLSVFQNSGKSGRTVKKYLGEGDKKNFLCPEKLKYQFTENFDIKVSDKCCYKLKKEPAVKWSRGNNRPITMTGMRNSEGGLRQTVSACTVFTDDKCTELRKFHPLLPLNENWVEDFIKQENIKLCELYYSPYNFKRTGCKGCPFSVDLQKQLEIMSMFLPNEKKQCEIIWEPVYTEYRRIKYRLNDQPTLFE